MFPQAGPSPSQGRGYDPTTLVADDTGERRTRLCPARTDFVKSAGTWTKTARAAGAALATSACRLGG
jgi:hypothetical protein